MAGARDFRDLDAWKLADQVRSRVVELTDRPAFRQAQELRVQLLEAAESACANIAEGFARFLPKDHARFLRIAKGSLAEVIDRLEAATKRRLVASSEADAIALLADRSSRACTGLIRYLETAKPPGMGPRRPPRPRRNRDARS